MVQQELTEWKRPVIDGLELPRRAGMSSFGAGGSNAHIVIEEYIPPEMNQFQNSTTQACVVFQGAIIVLSARTEEQLQEQAQRLLAAVKEREFSDSDLAEIASTLQVGREAMEERLAIVAGSIKEFQEKLQKFVQGDNDSVDIYRGQARVHQETLHDFTTDVELQEAVDKWIERGKYEKLADFG